MRNKLYFTLLSIFFLFSACEEEVNDSKEESGNGFLSVNISANSGLIEENARMEDAKSTDISNFTVTIFDTNDQVVLQFAKFSELPSEIKLPVGQYYVVASSGGASKTGFNAPYFSGQSDVFVIAEGELTSVEVLCFVANAKFTVEYSEYVRQNFTGFSTNLTDGTNSFTLTGVDERAVYFAVGSTVIVETELQYGNGLTKILRDTFQIISPRAYFRIFIDAQILDGVINPFSIILNESMEETGFIISDPNAFDNIHQGLVAAYSFDGDQGVAEEPVNGHNGTITGATLTSDRNNTEASALRFDGDDIVEVNDFEYSKQQMAVSVWVKPNVVNDPINTEIVHKLTNPSNVEILLRQEFDRNYELEWNIGGVYYDMSSDGNGVIDEAIGLVTPSYNKFDHLVASYDGTRIQFFVNGTLIKEKAASGNVFNNTLPLQIGKGFQGNIDDVLIYERGLRDAEVFYLYSTYAANKFTK